jgi:hypothetical protein
MTRAVPVFPHRTLLVAALLLAAAAAAPRSAAAGDVERTYLRQKLIFVYVDAPNNVTQFPLILNNADIASGTETGAFWTSTKVPGLQRLVRSLLQPPGKGGDDYLQMLASWIVRVLDKPVMLTLVNDVDAPLTQAAMTRWDACDDGSGHAWPCAQNQATLDDYRAQCAKMNNEKAPDRKDEWAGHMTLGQTVFSSGSGGNPLATFIHELVHTQDRSDRQDVRFWLSSKWYNYGSDGTHYDVEAVPNIRASYGEGIANTMALFIDSNTRKRMFDWFANDDAVMVEKVAVPQSVYLNNHPCTSIWNVPSQDIWLYNQLKTAGAHELVRSPNRFPSYAYFGIRDIPPRFIVHSEYIIAMTFSEYAWHLGIGKFLKALKSNDAVLFRQPDSPIAKLYETLCTMGLDGRPLSAVQNVNEAGPKPYLIPLAYADFFTGYQSKTKADYASIFENQLPQAWVDMYWDGYKDAVRAAAKFDASHKPTFDELTDIAIALGVNQSVPDTAP